MPASARFLHQLPAAQFDLGVKPTFVPFNGGAPAMNALLGGQVDYMCADIVDWCSARSSGKIKVYAIASAERNPAMPNVPTTE